MITTPEQMREAAMNAVEDYCSDMPDLAGHGHSVGLKDAIRAIHIAPQPEGASQIVEYTNWRGETARRVIRPVNLWWGKTDWHPEEQWMLTAYDCEKDAVRDFAWQDMRPVPNPATSIAADPQPVAATVKPLDLSNTLKHAFLSGIVAARNIPGYDEINGPALWLDYDPTTEPAYARLLTIQPADPLSDPRVVAVVEALQVIKAAAMPIYGNHELDAKTIRDVWSVARAALRAIGGEA